MLKISEQAHRALREQALLELAPKILQRWFETLKLSGTIVGESGRAQIIAEIQQMGRDDPFLDPMGLVAFADLMLVDRANQIRNRGNG